MSKILWGKRNEIPISVLHFVMVKREIQTRIKLKGHEIQTRFTLKGQEIKKRK